MADNNGGENLDEKNQFVPEDEMSEEDQQKLKESEEFILNFKPEDLETADDETKAKLEDALKKAQTTIAQKRHYRGKWESVKPKPGAPAAPATPAAPAAPASGPTGPDRDAETDFRLDHPELPKEVQKEVIKFARANGLTPEDALKNPIIDTYVKDAKKKASVEDATPGPTEGGRGSGPQAKDWSNASQADIVAERNRIMNNAQ